MRKTKNCFGHYVLSADNGMTLFDGDIYTKVFVSQEDIDEVNWTEVDDSAVPMSDEITDTEALEILLGGAV
jgi:hypothetical protein